jgi:5-methylcytosine-specific restriction endonuclease McrBC GTP-binding regulatory subunit McrB
MAKEKQDKPTYQIDYSNKLISAKNIIFRGAPGTGKTYLAKQIAADIVSGGKKTKEEDLSPEEKDHIGFVQFHPSYDYTDFVEGLRPRVTNEILSFELESGSFKSFVEKAIKNYKEPTQTQPTEGQDNFDEAWNKFYDAVAVKDAEGKPVGYNKVTRTDGTPYENLIPAPKSRTRSVHPSGTDVYAEEKGIARVYRGLKAFNSGKGGDLHKRIVEHMKQDFGLKDYVAPSSSDEPTTTSNSDKYVFIIDEINRGEISKIFGELFFSIDPDYRGQKGEISTQYANLHNDTDKKFYIPENVYIIGTMNDIDRSVDTFDFAMRRRFTFIEITAEESAKNMNLTEDTKLLMNRLNDVIFDKDIGGLSQDYKIGASYFKEIDADPIDPDKKDALWDNKLEPLLKDYFRGERDATSKLENLKKVYEGKSVS